MEGGAEEVGQAGAGIFIIARRMSVSVAELAKLTFILREMMKMLAPDWTTYSAPSSVLPLWHYAMA